MIPEMRKEYKEKICRENHTYRICWRLYHELADIFSQETPIAEEFGAYPALLEQQRREQYGRYYEWGRALADGTHLVTETGDETGKINRSWHKSWNLTAKKCSYSGNCFAAQKGTAESRKPHICVSWGWRKKNQKRMASIRCRGWMPLHCCDSLLNRKHPARSWRQQPS